VEDAEEVPQVTFVKLWEKAAQYDASKSRPYTWVALALRGLCLDRLRAKKCRVAAISLPPDWDVPGMGHANCTGGCVMRGMYHANCEKVLDVFYPCGIL
jgi:DNA-directed RNA polymerase specialized sigma24 family protein